MDQSADVCPVCRNPLSPPPGERFWGCAFCGNAVERVAGQWTKVRITGEVDEQFVFLGIDRRTHEEALDKIHQFVSEGWAIVAWQARLAFLRRAKNYDTWARISADGPGGLPPA